MRVRVRVRVEISCWVGKHTLLVTHGEVVGADVSFLYHLSAVQRAESSCAVEVVTLPQPHPLAGGSLDVDCYPALSESSLVKRQSYSSQQCLTLVDVLGM